MSEHSLYPASFHAWNGARPPLNHYRSRDTRRKVSIPAHVPAHVRLVRALMGEQCWTYDEIAEISGVNRPTQKQWGRRTKPSYENLTAVLSALGWALTPTPSPQSLPPDLMGEITALALKLQRDIPETWNALIQIGIEQELLRADCDDRRAALLAYYEKSGTPTVGRPRKPANDNTKQAETAA